MARHKRLQNGNIHAPLRRSKARGPTRKRKVRAADPSAPRLDADYASDGGITVYSSSEFRITR